MPAVHSSGQVGTDPDPCGTFDQCWCITVLAASMLVKLGPQQLQPWDSGDHPSKGKLASCWDLMYRPRLDDYPYIFLTCVEVYDTLRSYTRNMGGEYWWLLRPCSMTLCVRVGEASDAQDNDHDHTR